MGFLVFLVLLALAAVVVGAVVKGNKRKALERKQAELEPVRQLAFEDVTALGEELQELDLDLAGRELDAGASTPTTSARWTPTSRPRRPPTTITEPEHVKHVTEILEDGRYAMACVRARVAGEPLPTRRPPCFFDPRHGLSVEDVPYTPPGGAPRDVPACALDAERVKAGAEPDIRKVMVGSRRVPYWQGGRAYQPYAAGYFGAFGPMDWMFMGCCSAAVRRPRRRHRRPSARASARGSARIGDGIGGMFDGIGDMFDGFDF